MAASISALVSGAADARLASALERALARTIEVTAVFGDIGSLRIAGWPSLGTLGLRGFRENVTSAANENDASANRLAAETHRVRA